MQLPENPRILIARMSAIGDTILTLPVLCALRKHFPTAQITWVVEKTSAPAVLGHEYLDEVIVLPRRWFKSLKQISQLRRQLRERKFDVSVDCQSISKTAFACRLSGAPIRIGAGAENARELSGWMNNHLVKMKNKHLVDRTLELLQPFGIESPSVKFRYPNCAEAESSIASIRKQLGLEGRYAVINPGASWDSKLWPAERLATVARHLGDRHTLPSVVVWAGDRERQWAETIVADSGGHATLAPNTSLIELAALLRTAKLFVSADTGPLHMAAALQTPSIGLYGTTRPADCGPYGDHCVAIQEYYQGGTHRERRSANNDAMRAITVDRVCQATDRMLAQIESENRIEAA